MNNKPKSNNVNDLLAAIQRKAPSNVASESVTTPIEQPNNEAAAVAVANVQPEPSIRAARRAAPVERKNRVGKPVQFWLHDEDRRRSLGTGCVVGRSGVSLTDSLIIRAALRTAKTGGELLNAYREAAQLDGRLKQHKTS